MNSKILLFIVFISFFQGYATQTCKSYFQLSIIQETSSIPQVSKEIFTGTPLERVYLEISDIYRLRYYNVQIIGSLSTLAARPILKMEEKVFLGVYSENQISAWGREFSRSRYELHPTRDSLKHEVYEWVPRLDIPIDSKTGLIDANHDTGKELLSLLVNQSAKSSKYRDGILFVDINNLKMANSMRRAHVAGDEYIERAIAIVKPHLRLSGNRQNSDVGFKVGGDEFVFIIRNMNVHRLNEISNRISQSVADDRQLRDLFSEPVRDFQEIAAKLWSLGSYKELLMYKELHRFLLGSQTWMSLSVRERVLVERDSSEFRHFINRYLKSLEVEVLLRQFEAIKPGISVGRSLIRRNSSYSELYQLTDKDMTLRKIDQKKLDYSELPPDTVVTPDIFTLPSIR